MYDILSGLAYNLLRHTDLRQDGIAWLPDKPQGGAGEPKPSDMCADHWASQNGSPL